MIYTGVSDKALDERWRRQWPWCRPTNGSGGPESERFREEFLIGSKMTKIDGQPWTYNHIYTGRDRGGPNGPPFAGNAQQRAAQQEQKELRDELSASMLLHYLVENPSLNKVLSRDHGDSGYDMWQAYLATC
jgi:hypothetical protein